MGSKRKLILAVNGGSSSIKFSAFECADNLHRILRGKLEGVGSEECFFTTTDDKNEPHEERISAKNYSDAIDSFSQWLQRFSEDHELIATGHRIVHGSNQYFEPLIVTADALANLRRLSSLDPDHLPVELGLVEAVSTLYPDVPHVACFDTAFHRDMPKVAQLLPIPRRYFDMGIKRYGFHGLSCQYLIKALGERAGNEVAHGKVLLAHLGNGASVTAVDNGKSVDTSMGLTPCSGLPMSSRSGDLDPGLALRLAQVEQINPQQFQEMINHASGLKGISTRSGNIKELLELENRDKDAAEAIDFFCYQTAKWMSALACAMGGVETIVFSGGIGENQPDIRARICEKLRFLGVAINLDRNTNNSFIISGNLSQIRVAVIDTDEELVIAENLRALLSRQQEISI